MKNISKILLYVFLGFFSFFFFLYLSFPYSVVKESLVLHLNSSSELDFELGQLSPKLPIGIHLDKVRVSNHGGQHVELEEVEVKLSPLALFMGRAQAEVLLRDLRGGSFDALVGLPLVGLLQAEPSLIPEVFELNAQGFEVGNLINFMLQQQAQAPDANLMIKPFLESISIRAKLNAAVDVSLNPENLQEAEGKADISFDKANFKSVSKNLLIPEQAFGQAKLSFLLSGGKLSFAKGSAFVSQDLDLRVSGDILPQVELEKSRLQLEVKLQLGQPLIDQVGVLLDAAAGRDTKGKLTVRLSGDLGGPTVELL